MINLSEDNSLSKSVSQALLQQLFHQELPRALKIKVHLLSGEPINDLDMRFLQLLMLDITHLKTFADRHPEYRLVILRSIKLYREISDLAVANEAARPRH